MDGCPFRFAVKSGLRIAMKNNISAANCLTVDTI